MDVEEWIRSPGESLTADATVGAVVTLAVSFVPFSSIGGGLVAGHRRSGGYLAGIASGTLAGVLAAVPLVVLFVPAMAIAGRLGFGMAPSSPAYDLFLAIVGALFLVYTVGLSALGGLLGTWTRAHTEWRLDPVEWL